MTSTRSSLFIDAVPVVVHDNTDCIHVGLVVVVVVVVHTRKIALRQQDAVEEEEVRGLPERPAGRRDAVIVEFAQQRMHGQR